ncbi:M48 family metallopeptidase [Salinilacihabitans rarus]|uniref:M48 family metallopeptidase n=1 Tax=Salinilacihabitans rarus TaxID=2961596 RepID=UPI0020C897AD|nr:M48 family metalloprotease [Salinilacihabitans rarus]
MADLGLRLRMLVVGSILAAFYLFVGIVGLTILGPGSWPLVVVLMLTFPVVQYKIGTWSATRGAEEMPETGPYGEIHRATESLSRDMGIEKPRLLVTRMGVPNAFATGRRGDGVVVVSEELVALLDRDELEGVVAHELAHIKNRDVLLMTLGSSIGMMVGWAVYFVYAFAGDENPGGFLAGYALSVVAQLLVTVFVMAISRYREYVADADARRAIGGGEPLARALEKIARGAEGRESRVDDSVSALCIFNADRGLLQTLFATHPPTEKRIERLRR